MQPQDDQHANTPEKDASPTGLNESTGTDDSAPQASDTADSSQPAPKPEPEPSAGQPAPEPESPEDTHASAGPATPSPEVSSEPAAAEDENEGSSPATTAPESTVPAKRKRRWLLPVVVAAVLVVLLGGGYLFAFYLPNRPSAIYATSLKRTGEGLDTLSGYSNDIAKKGYKSYALTGNVQYTGSASFDGSLSGSADANGNALLKLSADVLGEKMNANIRSVRGSSSNTPDVYVQLTGIKNELDSFGLSSLDSLDGKWIAVDHTLISSYAASLNEQASGLAKSNVLPTTAQLNDAIDKTRAVSKQYIFTTDPSKAVLANEKFLGTETKDGRSTYHYTVSYNKAHLQAYVSALSTAFDSSSLNTWAQSANNGKSLSQTLNFDSLKKSVSRAKPGYSFDLWVDAKTRLVHSVSFAIPGQQGAYVTVTQNYTGGTTYPFAIHSYGKNPATGNMETDSIDVALDTKTDSYKGSFVLDEGKDMHASLKFTLTPSKKDITVMPPKGAEPIMSLLAQWGLSADKP